MTAYAGGILVGKGKNRASGHMTTRKSENYL